MALSAGVRAVAATRILDEADIVEAFVRHTAAYVVHHVFIDNGSSDGTLDILAALKREGFAISVFQSSIASFTEEEHSTWLFRQAATAHGADWVLPLDTDEFIDDRNTPGGLIAALGELSSNNADALCVKLPAFEYFASPDDDQSIPVVASRVRKRYTFLSSGKVFVHSSLAAQGAIVRAGNHAAMLAGERVAPVAIPGLALAHYPNVTAPHRLARALMGWLRVLAAGPEYVAWGAGSHYKGHFEQMKKAPEAILNQARQTYVPADAIDDPITYRGGPLLYTQPRSSEVEALRSLTAYAERLAIQHGRLVSESPEAAALVQGYAAEMKPIL